MSTRKARRQRGLSLVEQIVFIVVVGVAVAGVLAAMNVATRGSADPMIQKQALAIAEAVLEEVQLQPFTRCDPDDTSAATATAAADCTGGAGGANDESTTPLGREAGEDRYSAVTPFDNVSDYSGFDSSVAEPSSGLTGIRDMGANLIDGLEGYRVTVNVAGSALGPGAVPPTNIPANESLLITVTVTGPANTTVTLHGYRTRYAPNALP